jgi:zinc finger protein CONSTANS
LQQLCAAFHNLTLNTLLQAVSGQLPDVAMRTCAICQTAFAKVYCAADQAFLCTECDVSLHNNTKSASQHDRYKLCDLCESEKASIFCRNDAAFLCNDCDAEIHLSNPLAARHERTTVQALGEVQELVSAASPACAEHHASHSPVPQVQSLPVHCDNHDDSLHTVPDFYATVNNNAGNLSDFGKEAPLKGYKDLDVFDFEGSLFDMGLEFGGFDDCDMLSNQSNSDGVVPVIDVKQESLSQSSSDLSDPSRTHFDLSLSRDNSITSLCVQQLPLSSGFLGAPGSQAPLSLMPTISATPVSGPALSSLPGMMPMPFAPPTTSANVAANQKAGSPTWTCGFDVPQEVLHVGSEKPLGREERVMRYREKRKRRTFEKTIRYQSRKAYAEIRPRIKGRFATKEEVAAMKAAGTFPHMPEDLVVPVIC